MELVVTHYFFTFFIILLYSSFFFVFFCLFFHFFIFYFFVPSFRFMMMRVMVRSFYILWKAGTAESREQGRVKGYENRAIILWMIMYVKEINMITLARLLFIVQDFLIIVWVLFSSLILGHRKWRGRGRWNCRGRWGIKYLKWS